MRKSIKKIFHSQLTALENRNPKWHNRSRGNGFGIYDTTSWGTWWLLLHEIGCSGELFEENLCSLLYLWYRALFWHFVNHNAMVYSVSKKMSLQNMWPFHLCHHDLSLVHSCMGKIVSFCHNHVSFAAF
jgi:hypothetical protein